MALANGADPRGGGGRGAGDGGGGAVPAAFSELHAKMSRKIAQLTKGARGAGAWLRAGALVWKPLRTRARTVAWRSR